MAALPIGLSSSRPSPSALISAIVEAERAGIPTVWSTVAGTAPDAVTIFAAAATRTERIALGTSIVPAYPRHPLALASQALVLADLAPGRFRLGVGTKVPANGGPLPASTPCASCATPGIPMESEIAGSYMSSWRGRRRASPGAGTTNVVVADHASLYDYPQR